MSKQMRCNAFKDWFLKYGPTPAKYLQALEEPHQVLAFRKQNPSQGHIQAADLDLTVFPPVGESIFSLYLLHDVKTLFDETGSFRPGDDGAMHTAIGYYSLWLRLVDVEEWLDEPFWDKDCSVAGIPAVKTRMGTLLENGYDYLKALENRKVTYMYDSYLASIRTKPFILLAGISGTGKSRLVRQLARGCCPPANPLSKDPKDPTKEASKPGNFESIPVRPNWHDSTELIGYVTRITEDKKPKFVLTPFVKFLAKAWMNEDIPFFLCLDEMNLAPVEQYFAEYLSVIESRKKIAAGKIETDVMVRFDVAQSSLPGGGAATTGNFVKETVAALLGKELASADNAVKAKAQMLQAAWEKDGGIRIPENFIVMGTVNMDETTCTFSRKVLDRAMSFELNIDDAMYSAANLSQEKDTQYGSIAPALAKCELQTGNDAYLGLGQAEGDKVLAYIKALNEAMKNTQFKIAYRSRNEIMIYCRERTKDGLVGLRQALDEATSMKILSRIEGDDQKFTTFKLGEFLKIVVEALLKIDNPAVTAADVNNFLSNPVDVAASPSASKLKRMDEELTAGAGFVSYWEC